MTAEQDNKAGGAPQGGQSGETSQAGQAQAAQSAQKPKAETKPAAASKAEGAVALLSADHRKAEALFAEYEKADDDRKSDICREVSRALIIHALLEEEIFYPALREAAGDAGELLDEAQVEHDSAKTLIRELMEGAEGDRFRDAKLSVLSEQIRHHVAEEEKPGEGVFAKAKAAGIDTADLAQRLTERKTQLEARAERLPPPKPASFKSAPTSTRSLNQEEDMPRQGSNNRDRDDQGRFVSDDDRGRGGGRYEERSFARYRDDDGDDRGGRGRGGQERDDRGRFSSDDDDRGGRSYASRGGGGRSRYDDDDDRGGRGRGQGGWFGDPEGHSEASRRGWEERGGGSRARGGRDDDDDRGGRGGGRGQGGWFGDPEGHSEASRRGWEDRGGGGSRARGGRDDDDDRGSRSGGRGQGGWFGDPEGHSEASRRGWEERGGGGSRARGGRDDDDDRGGRAGGRGQGGWFGDSEGHSEASRRGWEDRGGSRARGGRDDDDDDRGGRGGGRGGGGRGQGGWFGDSEGHADAARRGWNDRR